MSRGLMGHLHGIITFGIVRCRQMKILKETIPYGVSIWQGTQITEIAPQRCFTKMVVWQKTSSGV